MIKMINFRLIFTKNYTDKPQKLMGSSMLKVVSWLGLEWLLLRLN